ncbi:MAG: ATP-dependent Clp protease ATP-binding subunit ClpX [Dehalococcoidales bacterium]|nr:ATP-dependent Clp protease ATP-binding subunit ClpX [Dehalococcoidales bacterium]
MQCTLCKKIYNDPEEIKGYPGERFGYPEVSLYFCLNCFDYIQSGFDDNLEDITFSKPELNFTKIPKDISSLLSEYVIGQIHAKKVLSVAVYNHYKRLKDTNEKNIEIQKSNILLVGSTGSGKTYLAQTLSRILDVPFSISDATSLTEAGYVGEDVENILLSLYQAADGDIEKTEKGIIYIDEIDKIARKSVNPSLTKELGEGTQQSLLKILEGSVVNVPRKGGRKHPEQDFLQIDTTGILFILGGAFEGLDILIDQRVNDKTIGFDNISSKRLDSFDEIKVETQDILNFGFIPEFVGRIASIVSLKKLSQSDLLKILKEPKNSLVKQYQRLFEIDNVKLVFKESSLNYIAEQALNEKNGARALKSILESLLLDVMFEIPSIDNVSECIVKFDKKNNKNIVELISDEGEKIKSFMTKKVA